MVNVEAYFNNEDAQAAITIPDLEDATLILTLDELDDLIGILMQLRFRLDVLRGDGAPTVN
ncbi:MAG TPA: hypothetical protein VFQ34_06265 [Nitrospiraceae bacterium]|nr:hypothetical protein [Nitrospiraceae bacterium]